MNARRKTLMKIGIIGAGNVGTGIAKHLVRYGHVVTLSFSKDLAELVTFTRSIGA
jgi:predicted dinucleotide-binding enzyme